MENKLKVLDVLPIDKDKSMVTLKGTNNISGFKYIETITGKKHKIIGLSTQSVEANRNKIIDLVVNGLFDNSSEAILTK